MKETRVANRYAKALFDLANELKVVEKIHEDARTIIDVCKNNREFLLVLRSPVVKDVKKLAILNDIFEKYLHELSLKFLVIITKNRREGIILEIAEQFVEIYKEHNNILTANLTTATKVDNETRDDIVNLLADRTKSKIELHEHVDEELIGGFVVSIDDRQYDASILRQIKNLQREFDINLYVKGF